MVLSQCLPCRNSRAMTFCVYIILMSQVLSLDLSNNLNNISTSQMLVKFGYVDLELNIPVISFMTSGCLFTDE